jgi:hypothetical protein
VPIARLPRFHPKVTFPIWLGGPLGERLAHPILERLWRGNVVRLKAVIEKQR